MPRGRMGESPAKVFWEHGWDGKEAASMAVEINKIVAIQAALCSVCIILTLLVWLSFAGANSLSSYRRPEVRHNPFPIYFRKLGRGRKQPSFHQTLEPLANTGTHLVETLTLACHFNGCYILQSLMNLKKCCQWCVCLVGRACCHLYSDSFQNQKKINYLGDKDNYDER